MARKPPHPPPRRASPQRESRHGRTGRPRPAPRAGRRPRAADGTEGVAGHDGGVAAVIDQQRHAALRREPAGDGLGQGLAGRPELEQVPSAAPRSRRHRLRERRGAGAAAKRRAPWSSTPTIRSCQRPPAARTAAPAGHRGTRWPRGAGPIGREAGKLVVPTHGQPGQRRRLPLAQHRAGLDQMNGDRGRNSGTTRAALSASAISVPRPGPSSTSATRAGRPRSSQCWTMARPISSPNSWLTSGAVTKSPAPQAGRGADSSRGWVGQASAM